MAQADEIARDIVVAWLSHNFLTYNNADKVQDLGKKMGEMYTAVLQAVRAGGSPSTPSTPPMTSLVP